MNEPGVNLSVSLALNVVFGSMAPAAKVYVVKGTRRGWKISVEKFKIGPDSGYVAGKVRSNRRTAEEYGPSLTRKTPDHIAGLPASGVR